MLTDRLTDSEFYGLITGILALGTAGLMLVAAWPFDGGAR